MTIAYDATQAVIRLLEPLPIADRVGVLEEAFDALAPRRYAPAVLMLGDKTALEIIGDAR